MGEPRFGKFTGAKHPTHSGLSQARHPLLNTQGFVIGGDDGYVRATQLQLSSPELLGHPFVGLHTFANGNPDESTPVCQQGN